MNKNFFGKKVYIAAPFFNEEQLGVVVSIEQCLDIFGIDYYSPRLGGIIVNEKFEDKEHKEKRLSEIYNENIRMLQNCGSMIAVIDGRDIGTIFEIGYFSAIYHSFPKPIVTFTNQNYGVNVMLRNSCGAHVHGSGDLMDLLTNIKNHDMKFCMDSIRYHQNFSENVT